MTKLAPPVAKTNFPVRGRNPFALLTVDFRDFEVDMLSLEVATRGGRLACRNKYCLARMEDIIVDLLDQNKRTAYVRKIGKSIW
jgi:hypothetical protein